MPTIASRARSCLGAALFLFALGSGPAAFAQSGRAYFLPDNLLLSRVVYDDKRSNVVAIRRGPTATETRRLVPPGRACRRRLRACRRRPFNTIRRCCRRRGFSPTTCAS
jgi:hypothetical protein